MASIEDVRELGTTYSLRYVGSSNAFSKSMAGNIPAPRLDESIVSKQNNPRRTAGIQDLDMIATGANRSDADEDDARRTMHSWLKQRLLQEHGREHTSTKA